MSDAKIPLMRTTFTDDQKTRRQLAAFLLRAERLSMGEQCAEFEHEFAAWQGRRHAVLVSSGSAANLALLQALKNLEYLHNGARIGFSALTWATNPMPIIQLGMTPVPIDVEPTTLNISSRTLSTQIANLNALFVTNALGFAGDLDVIRNLCRSFGVLLIEDNCEALGTELPEGKAGNFGLASTFSFYVAHHLSSIEGGAVCTDDDELAEMLRMVRSHGWDRHLEPAQQQAWRTHYEVSDFDAPYTFYDLAYNLRPTEITGFLARNQLRHLERNITRRQAHYLELEQAIQANPDCIPLDRSHIKRLSAFAFPVVCRSRASRNRMVRTLQSAGVEVRPMIAGNLTRQPFWNKHVSERYDLPGADKVSDCGFYFGLYPELTPTDLSLLAECLAYEAVHDDC
jgi:CDP-6-deoxy-D-xylo-4-hexulose-3-dehydrase